MNSIYDIRRDNAQLLVNFIGNKTLFSERIERSPTQVSRILGLNPTRNIGEKLARHIEHCFCLPKFWLDQAHQEPANIDKQINTINQDRYEHLHHVLCELYQATITKRIDESTYHLLVKVLEHHQVNR
ncbi:hypothetical protein JX580_08845 [Thiomicrospira microaerophila]|uniref:hypothetical protein n=1 Tax=Thiomicrospira microaerophila TaxID=406020 RepID=UPI00200D22D6|nr:hypothetical protein [Thiomicrospira microaerophila]UQB41770.1 hypothetical protein JX580_08845 [Thiomicrospira microaerophila]